jgi:hypothetical protein
MHRYADLSPSVCFRAAGTHRLNDQPKVKTSKKPAPAPFGASKQAKVTKNPLFESHPKNFGIGAFVK